MSYLEVIKKYESHIGKKFTYEDAIAFWTALNEPYKLQLEHHLKCADHSNIVVSQENCKIEKTFSTPMDNSKKLALSFFNRTLNNTALFSKDNKDKLLKAVRNTLLFKKIEGNVGGYYEKYLKYKQKYLALKAQLEGGDCIIAGKSASEMIKCASDEAKAKRKANSAAKVAELESKLASKSPIVDNFEYYFEALETLYVQSKDKKYADIAEKLFDTLKPKGFNEDVWIPTLSKKYKNITKKEIGHNVWKSKL